MTRWSDEQTNKQTNKQANKQTNKQTKHTHTPIPIFPTKNNTFKRVTFLQNHDLLENYLINYTTHLGLN